MYPKIAAGVGDTRLATPQRLTVQIPAPARGTRVRLSCDPWGGPERTTSHSRFQKGEAGQEFFLLAGHAHSRPAKASSRRIGCSCARGYFAVPYNVRSDGRPCTSLGRGTWATWPYCESPVTQVKQTNKQTNKPRGQEKA